MEFSRQEYWSMLSFPSLRASPALVGGFFTIAPPRNCLCMSKGYLSFPGGSVAKNLPATQEIHV